MPLNQLKIDGEPAWQLDYDLPALWPWLFDPSMVTESRRLFTTPPDAADRFRTCAVRAGRSAYFAPYIDLFEEIRPDSFGRSIDARPDSILSLDLLALEEQRPYSHERAAQSWQQFFVACEDGNDIAARAEWSNAVLNPLVFQGGCQRDARAFAMRAEELHLPREGRATALVRLLFGEPLSRAAKALTFEWIAQAAKLPAVGMQPKKRWLW